MCFINHSWIKISLYECSRIGRTHLGNIKQCLAGVTSSQEYITDGDAPHRHTHTHHTHTHTHTTHTHTHHTHTTHTHTHTPHTPHTHHTHTHTHTHHTHTTHTHTHTLSYTDVCVLFWQTCVRRMELKMKIIAQMELLRKFQVLFGPKNIRNTCSMYFCLLIYCISGWISQKHVWVVFHPQNQRK